MNEKLIKFLTNRVECELFYNMHRGTVNEAFSRIYVTMCIMLLFDFFYQYFSNPLVHHREAH